MFTSLAYLFIKSLTHQIFSESILIPGTIVNAKNITVESLPSISLHSSGRRQIIFILMLLWVEHGFNENNNKGLQGDESVVGTRSRVLDSTVREGLTNQTKPCKQTLFGGNKAGLGPSMWWGRVAF